MPNPLARPVAQHDALTALQVEIDAIEGAFSEAVEALVSGREGLVKMIAALRSYEEGLQSCIDQDLPQVLGRLAARLADAETRDTESLRKLERMISDISGVEAPMHHLRELIRTLEIFSSTASVVEAESELAGRSNFSAQIKSLSLKSFTGLQDLRTLVGELKLQLVSLKTAHETHASAGLQRLAGIGDRLTQLGRGVAGDLAKAQAPARRVHDVAGQVGERMNRTLASLQIGDSVRQRLEHVIEASRTFGPGTGTPPSARLLIGIIGVRQLYAAADALSRELATLPGDLRGLRAETGTLLTMGQDLKADTTLSARFLPIKDLSARSLSALYAGEAHRQTVQDSLRAMGAIVQDVKGTLDRQAVLDEEMKLGSLNVSLLSRSAIRGGSAMNYVTHEIAELIIRCLKQRLEVIDILSDIVASISDTQDQQALSADLDAIRDDLDGLTQVLHVWEALSGGVDALLQTGPASAAAFGTCADQMEAQGPLVDRVRELAAHLASACACAEADPKDLYREPRASEAADWMRTLYSVPEERDLHDDICGTFGSNRAERAADPDECETDRDEEFEWF